MVRTPDITQVSMSSRGICSVLERAEDDYKPLHDVRIGFLRPANGSMAGLGKGPTISAADNPEAETGLTVPRF